MAKTVLSFEHLSFQYDEMPILEDVNVEIGEGEFVGIFGPDGGGKTTLLKLAMGFLTPKKGKVSLLGSHRVCPSSDAL